MGWVEDSGKRPPTDGEMGYGGSLPPWQAPLRPQCVIRYGRLECFCGECEAPEWPPERLEEEPENTPGWTVQQARQALN